MKIKSLILGAALVCIPVLSSCGGSETKADQEAGDNDTLSTEAVAKAPTTGVQTLPNPEKEGSKVIYLADDSILRPEVEYPRPVIIDFNATWCGPCNQFAPTFHKAAEEYSDVIDFVSVDSDENPNTVNAFAVTALPTIIVMVPGQPAKIYVGTTDLLPEQKFMDIVKQVADTVKK